MITKEDIIKAKENKGYLAQLMEENRNLIFKAIQKYLNKAIDNEDVWQEGYYAFTDSVLKYDLSSKYKPHNYIYNGVLNHVNSYTRSNTGVVQIPYECFVAHGMYKEGKTVVEIKDRLKKTTDTVNGYLKTGLGVLSYETSVEMLEEDKCTPEDKEIYEKLSGKSAELVYMDIFSSCNLRNKIQSLFESELDYKIFLYSVTNKINQIEAYKHFITEEKDKQGRPVGYPAYSYRINKIKKIIKESIAMGYQI